MVKKSKNKKKKPKKSHIKHQGFKNFNISSLDDHERDKGKLHPPLSTISSMVFSSWRDSGLNDVLWAVILRGNMDQKSCLKLFRQIVIYARKNLPDRKNTFITHSALSVFSEEQFDIWIQPILNNEEATTFLRALLFFNCLPDRHHWERHFQTPESEVHSNYLLNGVSSCMDHQSQESTDIRWLKIIYKMVVCEGILFSESMREMVEEIRLYPDYGDQRKVRPRIRAMELSFRGHSTKKNIPDEIPDGIKKKVPDAWHDPFWKECLTKTPCFTGELKSEEVESSKHYLNQFVELYKAVTEHFMATLEGTDINPRHDTVFGIPLYSVLLAIDACKGNSPYRVQGRLILRTLVEGYITLKYLEIKDDQKIWEQFRNYGTGQSKLAFLKNLREESLPDFINLEDLHKYANEDMWQEYSEVNLKSWAQLNLRKMAEEASLKDFYDKYYDWSSGFVHGHWGAIRDTVFTTCLNPLHRHHRIPFIPRLEMPSVLPDVVKIINLLLDILNNLYPTFQDRVK